MTYNVFSGTLNPTHFTSLHCFRLEMISWRRELKDLARLCRQLQLLLLVGRCVFLYVARPAGAMSMHVTFNPQLGWDAVPWAYFLVNFYKGGAGLSYLNTLSENCLFYWPITVTKIKLLNLPDDDFYWLCGKIKCFPHYHHFMQVHHTFPYVDCRTTCHMAISDYYWKEVMQVR